MLLFFAGYEIDIRRNRASATARGGRLAALADHRLRDRRGARRGRIVLSLVYTGSALATTAIGTLIPVLSVAGELRTRFGGYLLAAGAVGEFGPILLLTLILSSQSTLHNALILTGFVAVAVGVAVLAVRSSSHTVALLFPMLGLRLRSGAPVNEPPSQVAVAA